MAFIEQGVAMLEDSFPWSSVGMHKDLILRIYSYAFPTWRLKLGGKSAPMEWGGYENYSQQGRVKPKADPTLV